MGRLGVWVLAFAVSGCSLLSGKKTTSGWLVLDRASSAECGKWPLGPKDLAINDIKLVSGKKRGFLATGIKRDGGPVHYFMPFDGDVELSVDDLVPLKIGRGAVIAGGHDLTGGGVFGVVHNVKDKASYEIRNLRDNVVRVKSDLASAQIQDAWLTSAAGGQWLQFRRDDNDIGIAYVDTRKPSAITTKASDVSFKDQPVLLPLGDSSVGAIAIWREGESLKPFKVRPIGLDGASGNPVALDLAVESQAESWSAATHAGSHYVAVVDGDSLIGQATLRIASFGWGDAGTSIKWSKDLPLKDVHVTEPVFHSAGGRLQILVLKWVDEESTIARYKVAGGTVATPTYAGIFPKGSRIVTAFAGEDEDDTYVVVRHKDDMRWVFQLCKI